MRRSAQMDEGGSGTLKNGIAEIGVVKRRGVKQVMEENDSRPRERGTTDVATACRRTMA